MKKLGVLIDKFDICQKSIAIIEKLNTLHDMGMNVVLYVAEQSPLSTNCRFPIFYQREAWMSKCTIIANDISTAQKLLLMPAPTKKLLYVWDMQWLFMGKIYYSILKDVYNNRELNVIAPSDHYFSILKKVWRTPDFLCPNFNIEIAI